MKKQDEIAQLINGSRKEADTFISQINHALPERASFSEIAHALRKLSPEKRTPENVIAALGGQPKGSEHEASKRPIEARHEKSKGGEGEASKPQTHLEGDTRVSVRAATVPKADAHKPKLKTNWREFQAILKANHITCLYHFTDSRNIPSIIEYGGLYSWQYCESNGIAIPCAGGNLLSRRLDVRYSLQDYVRLNFNPNPPMLYVAEHIQNPVILEVDPSVIYWATTKFSDINATDNMASIGDGLDDFQRIRFNVATNHNWKDEMEKKWRQAEVMVKTNIPLSYMKIPQFQEYG